MSRSGVLLMAHGTPASMDDMPEYLRLVRGGRPPSPELVAEMRHNYEAIGGRSPLTDLTIAQAQALAARLGGEVPVAIGMRNWKPFIREGLDELRAAGVRRVIAIPLAPQFSTLSVVKYYDAARAAAGEDIEIVPVDSYHAHPLLLEAFAERLEERRPPGGTEIVFTAHALPQRVVDAGDHYLDEVNATARGVARRAGVTSYAQAFQSAGRTPEPWTGPALDDLVRDHAAAGVRRFLVVPIGFVCDHTEILFDVDVQAKAAAQAAGAALDRTASLNSAPTFIRMLEDLVRAHL
jgi:ferrochelatase